MPSVLHGVAQPRQPPEHALHDLAERVPGEVAEERRFLAALVPDPVARLNDVTHVVVGQQRARRAPHGLEQHVQDLGQDHVVVVGIGRLEPAQRDGVGDAVHGLRGVGVVLADEPVLQNLVHGGQRHPERWGRVGERGGSWVSWRGGKYFEGGWRVARGAAEAGAGGSGGAGDARRRRLGRDSRGRDPALGRRPAGMGTAPGLDRSASDPGDAARRENARSWGRGAHPVIGPLVSTLRTT